MRRTFTPLLLCALLPTPGCDKKPDAPAAPAAAASAAAAVSTSAVAAAAPPPAAALSTDTTCPEGSWVVASVKAQAEEVLAKAAAHDMSVAQTSGTTEYTFTSTGPGLGRYRMDAQGGKALSLTVDAAMGSQTQRTRVDVIGNVEGTYKKLATGELVLDQPSVVNVNAKATVTIAGKTVELPTFQVPNGAWNGTVRAVCTGDALTLTSVSAAHFYNGLRLKRR